MQSGEAARWGRGNLTRTDLHRATQFFVVATSLRAQDASTRRYASPPAIEAGIADHVWRLEEIAALVPEPVAKKRWALQKSQSLIKTQGARGPLGFQLPAGIVASQRHGRWVSMKAK